MKGSNESLCSSGTVPNNTPEESCEPSPKKMMGDVEGGASSSLYEDHNAAVLDLETFDDTDL